MTYLLRVLTALSVALSAYPAAMAAQAIDPPDPQTVVRFSLYAGGAIVVPVTIGGAGPYRFLLDTGSTRSAISARLAGQLRGAAVGDTAVVTPTGRSTRNLTVLPGVQLGSAPPLSVAAVVMADDALPHAGRVDGLLGQDVLARRAYTIDYRRRELVWHVREMPDIPGHRLPVLRLNGLLFVSLPATAGAPGPLRLLADSGADTIVLFGGLDRVEHSAKTVGTGRLRTSTGIQVGRHIRLDHLDLGGVILHEQSALLLADREPTGLLGDGLLPLHLFARVTFDGAGTLIVAMR